LNKKLNCKLQINRFLELANNVAEYVTNYRPKQKQDGDNNDSNEYKNEGVFYQTLAFFARKK